MHASGITTPCLGVCAFNTVVYQLLERLCTCQQDSCWPAVTDYLYRANDRTSLENRKLGLAVVHALVTQLPEGVLQLRAAQQQLTASLRAATQVHIHFIESLLEVSQLHHSTTATIIFTSSHDTP